MSAWSTRRAIWSPSRRRRGVSIVVVGSVLAGLLFSLPAGASDPVRRGREVRSLNHVVAPKSPVGIQLTWLLGVASHLPLSKQSEAAHFDAAFVKAEPAPKFTAALESLASTGSRVSLLSLSNVTSTSLVARVEIGSVAYDVDLSVDEKGLIAGLYFSLSKSVVIPKVSSWSAVDKDLKSMAPDVGFLAARLDANGTCSVMRELNDETARPLGSMFKLFVLGALARAVRSHSLSWGHHVTLTDAEKVGGSGVLDEEPDGTRLTVEQTALEMISVSDNTAAEMLFSLLGRNEVENQVRAWSSHLILDTPFLSPAEFFVLKWYDYPHLANDYLSLDVSQRLSYLSSTVDRIGASSITSTPSPHDIDGIEWFASPLDMCHAFSDLASLERTPELRPLNQILSANNGGIPLNDASWPRIWFKGGSEPGVLTLGYLARDEAGTTYVVIEMLSNPRKPLATASTLLGLGVVAGSFTLLRSQGHGAIGGAP